MAKATTQTNPLDARRVSDIAEAMFQASAPFNSTYAGIDAARLAKSDADDKHAGSREDVIKTMADLSTKGSWTLGEIKAAVPIAAAKINGDDRGAKAHATFISEIKRVAYPLVRAHIPNFITLRDKVWDAEQEQLVMDKSATTPVRHAFKRRYHVLLTGLCGAAEEGLVLSTPAELTAYATLKNPDHDAAKILKRLDKIRQDLAEIAVDFPVEDISHCAQTLENIEKVTLEAARAKKISDTMAEVTHIAPPAPVSVLPVAKTTPVAPEILQGVVDFSDPDAILGAMAA